jgi:hypothetical protein
MDYGDELADPLGSDWDHGVSDHDDPKMGYLEQKKAQQAS